MGVCHRSRAEQSPAPDARERGAFLVGGAALCSLARVRRGVSHRKEGLD